MCESCAREFTKLRARGVKIHLARCDGGRTQPSRVGSLTYARQVEQETRSWGIPRSTSILISSDPPLENAPHFEYLGSRPQGDEADVSGSHYHRHDGAMRTHGTSDRLLVSTVCYGQPVQWLPGRRGATDVCLVSMASNLSMWRPNLKWRRYREPAFL